MDIGDQQICDPRLVEAEIMRLRPEIMGRLVGLGRDRVEVPHGDALAAIAFLGARARLGGADIKPHEGRRRPRDVLPAIDMLVGGEPAGFLKERRRGGIHHPAGDRDVAVAPIDRHRRFGNRAGAQRGGVNIGKMRQIQ